MGFANYFFNRQSTDNELKALRRSIKPEHSGPWKFECNIDGNPATLILSGTSSGLRIADGPTSIYTETEIDSDTNELTPQWLAGLHHWRKCLIESDTVTATYIGRYPFPVQMNRIPSSSKNWNVSKTQLFIDLESGKVAAISHSSAPDIPETWLKFSDERAANTSFIPAELTFTDEFKRRKKGFNTKCDFFVGDSEAANEWQDVSRRNDFDCRDISI
ncbi:MAG: hypothetical protein R3C03_13145 [Pirellulaceae bacterium]